MPRGRPRLKGPRTPGGRLVTPARVPANDVVTARHAWYARHFGAKVAGDAHDAIGRAWAAGLLDNDRIDPAALRDIGRRYAHLHDRVFSATVVKTATLDPMPKGTSDGRADDPPGERYARLDAIARDAGSKERLAMRKLCTEPTPDQDPPWLARLIHARAGGVSGEARDTMILAQAIRALLAMAG